MGLTKTRTKQLADVLDWRAVEMLKLLNRDGGWVSTSVVREETGMSNGQVRYRREKLKEYDLIETEQGHARGDAHPPTRHRLTKRGRKALQDHDLAGFFSLASEPGTVDELLSRIGEIERGQAELQKEIRSVRGEIGDVRADLEERVGGVYGVGEQLDDLDDRLEELEAKAEQSRSSFF